MLGLDIQDITLASNFEGISDRIRIEVFELFSNNMGKHHHKKSFYDVDEDELQSSHKHHHHRHRRRHSYDKQDETKQRVPSIVPFSNSKIDDDEAALQSPPTKRQRSSSNGSQSPSKILSQLIENPEFLANAGPKAKEFAETARQLLANPDLDQTTQQIICAMAQAAVNVGKRLSSSSSTPADQCVDEISVTNSTTYSSSTLLSPTLSNTSSSSTSNTPQQQIHSIVISNEENKTSIEPESDEDILIKQMIERAMKLTQQGDTRHAQHLLGIIHEKLSNKRKRAAAAATNSNCNDNEKFKITSSNESHSLPSLLNEDSQSNHTTTNNKISSTESEQSNDYQNTSYFSYPPPPPLPPPPPPPPLPDVNSITSPPVSVPRIEQVQELLSNPSEVQDILKKLFGTNENQKISPPEEYQMQSHLTSPSSLYSQPPISFNNNLMYSSSRLNNNTQPLRVPQQSTATTDSQPYNSSLAYMQGNRRNLPPLQTTERCFSSSNNKNKQQPNRSFSFSSSSNNNNNINNNNNNNNGIIPLLVKTTPPPLISAPPLMNVNPKFSLTPSTPTPLESILPRWPNNNEQQRGFHPFWCATCGLGFPHQVAYQDHLRSHIPIHENNLRNRMSNNILHQTRPIFHQQQSLEPPWPLMRMYYNVNHI
ncbi:unnamed protein product [Rotaria sp. Silwood2]|nr:unnamed protein product [Rotaria sp. Silwood2]CAF4039835.1 unnamed protein product [Rotaria sp. Silwood2]CAF4130258.1 unnamed protein product [Rotaria sp. Silwood2]